MGYCGAADAAPRSIGATSPMASWKRQDIVLTSFGRWGREDISRVPAKVRVNCHGAATECRASGKESEMIVAAVAQDGINGTTARRYFRVAVQLPDAVLHVVLGTRTYEPV